MGFLRRRWRRGRRWLTDHRAAWQEARFERREWQRIHQAEERSRMLDADALQRAQAKALLAQLDAVTTDALKTVLKEETLPALREDALTLARQELAEEVAKAKERLEDQSAAYRERVDSEVEDRVSHGIEAAQATLMEDVQDRLQELREARNEARQQRDQAEHQLLHLLRQLLDEKGRYLRNSGILEFDQVGLNLLLRKHGWQVRSRATYSERTVKTKIGEARWQSRSVFRLEAVPAEGVFEGDEDGDEEPPPDRLALPEGAGA